MGDGTGNLIVKSVVLHMYFGLKATKVIAGCASGVPRPERIIDDRRKG